MSGESEFVVLVLLDAEDMSENFVSFRSFYLQAARRRSLLSESADTMRLPPLSSALEASVISALPRTLTTELMPLGNYEYAFASFSEMAWE
jgi:hypothetical protein